MCRIFRGLRRLGQRQRHFDRIPDRARPCDAESPHLTPPDACPSLGIGFPSGNDCVHRNRAQNHTAGRVFGILRGLSVGPAENIGNTRPCTEPCALLRTHRAGRAGSKIGTRFRIIGIPRQRPARSRSAPGEAPLWREIVSSCRSGLETTGYQKNHPPQRRRNQGPLAIERDRIRVGVGTWVHHFVLETCLCRHFGIRRDTGKDSFVTPPPSPPVLDLP